MSRICSIFFLIVALCATSAIADEAVFHQAVQLYREAQWQKAAEAFSVCTSDKPDSQLSNQESIAAHFYQAECLMQLEDFSKAREHYRIVLKQGSDIAFTRRALFRLGEVSWLDKDADSAKPLLQQFLHRFPHDSMASFALVYLGEIEFLSGNFERSIESYQAVIERYAHTPQVDKARLGLAKSLLATGRNDEVAVALGKLLGEEKSRFAAEALLLLGRSQYAAGKFSDALKVFRRISKLYPEHRVVAQAKLAAGWALWRMGDYDKVASEVASLEEESLWLVDVNYLVGMAEYGQEKWPEAIQRLSLALEGDEQHPGRDAILFYLGENCFRNEQVQDASKWFQTLVEKHPESRWADDALWGAARVARKEHEVEKFQTAVEQLKDNFPKSRYLDRLKQLQTGEEEYVALPYEDDTLNEAAGFQRDGLFDAALAGYHELLSKNQIGRTHSEALRLKAKLHYQLSQYPDASQLFEEFLAQYPDSVHAAEITSMHAWAEVKLGNLDAAATKFQVLYEKFPQSPQAYEAAYWLAVSAADKEKGAEAKKYVDWLLAHLQGQLEAESQAIWEKTVLLNCQLEALGERWQELDKFLAQENLLHEAFEEGSRKSRAIFWFAEAKFRLDQPKISLALFDELVEETKGVEEEWIAMVPLRRAQLRSRRQQWTEVLKTLESFEIEYANFPLQYEVNYLRGRAHAGLGEMTLARREYNQVLSSEAARNTTTATMAQWMIGETFFHQKDYLRARQAYQKVIEHHGQPEWQARAALQEGKCWELEQNWEEAKAVYEAAMKKWQSSASAEQIEARWKWADSQTTQRR